MRTAVAVVLSSLAMLACIAAPAGAKPSPPPGPQQDSVSGSLGFNSVFGPEMRFAFGASSGPTGENPQGAVTASFRHPVVTFNLSVTCLRVSGNRAVVGARQEAGGNFIHFYFVVIDEPGAQPDQLAFQIYFDTEPPATCAAFDAQNAATTPADSGSVTVTDASPFPTSREQCTDGGWASFGVFKNQGQCVAYLERGPKPTS